MSVERLELTTWECLGLLAEQRIGRLCIVDNGCPIALPVNYVPEGDTGRVVVRTSPGTTLGRYEGPGSLEVDHIDLDNGSAWSIIIRGTVRRAIASSELPDPKPILGDGRSRWITLEPSAISGRRFVLHAEADGFSVEWVLDAANHRLATPSAGGTAR